MRILKALCSLLVIPFTFGCNDDKVNEPPQPQVVAQSDFESGADGWTCAGDGDWSWQSEGGNPGGYLRSIDPAGGPNTDAIAPEKFLGSWTSLDGQGTLSYHFQVFEGQAAPIETPSVTISGPGGSATALTSTGPVDLGTWVNCSVAIQAAAWTMESGTWSALLDSVTEIGIDLESVNGTETSGIDNVKLIR